MSACHAAMRLVAPRALRANAAAASKRRVERGYAPRADRDATERARARVPRRRFRRRGAAFRTNVRSGAPTVVLRDIIMQTTPLGRRRRFFFFPRLLARPPLTSPRPRLPVHRRPSPLEPSGAITTSAPPRITSTPRRAVVARVSPPGSNAGPGGGHGAVGDGVVPDAAADAGARADWQAELAALESAAEERSASITEMQAMLAGMGQPAPPPPPAETPPRVTEVERAPADEATTSAHPAAAAAARSLDILPPPAPAAAPPPPPVPLAAPPVPIPAAAAPVPRAAAPPPPPPPRVDASFAGEHRGEVAAMLAADAPATTSQQCTGEVTSLMHKMATTPIPPPLSTKRFKMVRPTSAPAPVTSAPEGTEATAPAPAPAPAPAAEKKKADDLAGAPPQVLAAMAGDAEGVAALDAADASLATSLAVEEAEATKSVLGDAEDALAEALALAADEDEDDEAEAAEAEVEAEVEDEVSVSVSASAFPPASEWVGADAPSDEPSAATSDFPGRLSRAMRTITDWFTGVPFLDLYEAPAPEMATMTAAEMHLAAEERREMLARALRVVEIRPEASPSLSAVAVTPPRSEPSADAYGMNPVEEIPAPEPETLEEMDYESYLAFHGMEILEGTPPQVVAAMVGDLDAANRADAEDARRAERRAEARRKEAELASVDAALAALMAKKDVTDEALEAAANDAEARMMNERLRGEKEDDRTAKYSDRSAKYSDRLAEDTGADAVLASELRAASAALAASEQRATELELSLAALAAEAEAAKAEASAHKRKLAAAYERGERVSELLAEVDRWKDAHDASESARAAYAEEQAERKRLFVAEADERLAEAKAQAERSDAERAALAAALEEANAKVATAESEVATDAEALRAARLASAAAAEDAAATITEAAERLLEAKARAAKLKRQMDEADAEIRDVRAELESAKYAAGEAAREAEAARGVAEEARMAAAAAALCVAVSVVAKLNRNELGEVILEEA
jgi:hypothetical protein